MRSNTWQKGSLFGAVGTSVPRVDALAKVTGRARYVDDIARGMPELLQVKVLRSPFAHAAIEHIDATRALALPGVRAVVTGRDQDVPWVYSRADVFSFPAKDEVIWAGQGVAAVAAESMQVAEQALSLIDIRYQVLPHVLTVEEAMKKEPVSIIDPALGTYEGRKFTPLAPNIVGCYRLRTGDVDEGFAEADVVVENTYYASRISQCQLECASCIVRTEQDGGITMWTNGCGVHGVIKSLVCRMFSLPESKVRIIQAYQGGSFGNRLICYIEPLATLMALKTKGTVQVTFSRKEMFESGPSNWPVTTHIKTGAKRDGTIIAQQITLIEDTGASLNCFLDGRVSGSGAVCVYDIPNVHMDTYGVNTNTAPVGPYRGLGCPQSEWAVENQTNLLAHKLGMSPVEIRRRNMLERGATNAYGEMMTSIGVRTCLELVADAIKIDKPCVQEPGPWRFGKGIAVGGKQNTPLGRAEADVLIHSDGSVEVRYSADENGMGSETVMAQIVAEELKMAAHAVKVKRADTLVTPYDNFSASSRTTYTSGKAVLLACRDAIRQVCEAAAHRVGVSLDQVELAEGKTIIYGSHIKEIPVPDLFKPFERIGGQQQWGLKKGSPVVGHGVFAPGPCVMWDKSGHTPRMWNWYQYNACAVEAAVNVETGQIKVLKVYSASDMGFPINPKMCEGQIEGGVGMAIGFAINEEYLYDKHGKVLNGELLDYRIPTATDIPIRENFKSLFGPDPLPEGPYGAKGIGEAMMIPVAPAIAAAVHEAVGIRPTVLPMSAERILALLKEKERAEHLSTGGGPDGS